MKRLLAGVVAVAVGATVCSSMAISARAAEVVAGDIAAGAKWFVHIDLDAARDSKIGEHVRTQALKNEHAEEQITKLKEEFGLDVQKDVHGATVYGTDLSEHSGVLVVYANADTDKIVGYLKSKPDFNSSKTDDGQELYTWTANMGPEHKHTVWAAFPKAGVGVMADSESNLKAALGVVGGKGGLSSSSPLLADAIKGSIVHGAVLGLTNANLPIQHPLAKQFDDVYLAIGENEGDVFLKIKAELTSAEGAKQTKSMIEGLTGMIALQGGGANPDAQKLLNNLKVDAQDKELTIDWKAPADQLIKMGEKMQKQGGRQGGPGAPAPDGSEQK